MSSSNRSGEQLGDHAIQHDIQGDNRLSQNARDTELGFSHWQLPDVTQTDASTSANLFGYTSRPAPKVQTLETIAPPTMAEIEDICVQAEAEGFNEGKTQGHIEGLAQGRLEGLEQGHKEGFTQGHEQGLAAGLAEATTLLSRFEDMLSQFEQPLQILDGDIEYALISLTMALAKSVIGHELTTHPEHILSALRLGVESLPMKDKSVNLRMHPDDVALVETLYTSTQLSRNEWHLEADPSLSAGDCIISSQRSLVDLTLASRIDAVFESLRNQQAHLAQQQQQRQAALDGQHAAKMASELTPAVADAVTQSQDEEELDAQSSPSAAE